MSELDYFEGQCEHCGRKFWNREGFKLHKEVCDKDPAVLAHAERMPRLIALTPQQLADREAEKKKPLNIDWQEIQREILEEEARNALRELEGSNGTTSTVNITKSKKTRPVKDKPVDLTQWT